MHLMQLQFSTLRKTDAHTHRKKRSESRSEKKYTERGSKRKRLRDGNKPIERKRERHEE